MQLDGGKAPLVSSSAAWARPRHHGAARRRRRRSTSWRPAPSVRRRMITALLCGAALLVLTVGIYLVLEHG